MERGFWFVNSLIVAFARSWRLSKGIEWSHFHLIHKATEWFGRHSSEPHTFGLYPKSIFNIYRFNSTQHPGLRRPCFNQLWRWHPRNLLPVLKADICSQIFPSTCSRWVRKPQCWRFVSQTIKHRHQHHLSQNPVFPSTFLWSYVLILCLHHTRLHPIRNCNLWDIKDRMLA